MVRSSRLQVRKVLPTDLLPEEDVIGQGFAGHTIDDFPEPARSYNIAFSRLAPVFAQTKLRVPLLVRVGDEIVGVMNSIWSTRIGIVPIRRIGTDLFEVPDERIIFLVGDDLSRISFAMDEILITRPSWCK